MHWKEWLHRNPEEKLEIIEQLVIDNAVLADTGRMSSITIATLARVLDKVIGHEPPKPKIINIFNFEFLNYKLSSIMDAVLSVPSGTPVTGFNAAGDAKGNNLGDSRYQAGSCVYAVIPGPSGNPPGFTVAPGAREEAFVVTETVAGAASDGIITFNAKDSAGNPIPQSQGTLTFTAAIATVTQNLFNFDQTSH